MLKVLVSALSIVSIAVISAPAQATDWKVTGVSKRTGETVAIDLNSIDRRSQFDVRFRYLIGKDLVNASVNCSSSLVKPDKGPAFVPDMTGATREMINIACRSGGTVGDDDKVVSNFSPQSQKISCSFRSGEAKRLDKCLYSSSGQLARFIPENVSLQWSDGVKTQIKLLTIDSMHAGSAVGSALVDDTPATYTTFSTGGICVEILKNDNTICFD